jgi:3-hydroxyisobutyrate dehydrogenase-like beta-hydroxyacid dehydrogenase
MDVNRLHVVLVGYGEVGRIFGAALAAQPTRAVAAFDLRIDEPGWADEARARAAKDGVRLAHRLDDATREADLIVSAVTAASTAQAASQLAQACPRGAWVLDVNSASPRTKAECAEVVARAGARYVEAAMMSAVPPHGIRVPMLLGGPHASELQPALAALGFDAKVGPSKYGVVSAIKLCRSVIIKGTEALAIESLLAARRYGVEEDVLASLADSFPGMDWDAQGSYYWKRVVQHGKRRAEEMQEAATTMRDAGLPGAMSAAAAEVQAWIAALRDEGAFEAAPRDAGWRDYADLVDAAKSAKKRRAG